MARFRGGEVSAVAAAFSFFLVVLPAFSAWAAEPPGTELLYERPVLIVDPDMHTSQIWSADANAAGQFAVTGSDDKTVRVWSLDDGKLLQTIRVPAGPGNAGAVYSVAISPKGDLVAAAGRTAGAERTVYIFERATGVMKNRITGLPEYPLRLVFSADGRYLAAGLEGAWGLRVFDRDRDWSEAFRDSAYADAVFGVAFAPDGRLATASYDGKVRLYDSKFHLRATQSWPGRDRLHGLEFNPEGTILAVAHADVPVVDLLDGGTLERRWRADSQGLSGEGLYELAWSRDGKTLFAGGRYQASARTLVFAWDDAGHGKRRVASRAPSTIASLIALGNGRLLVATADPSLAVLNSDGTSLWSHLSPKADFRLQHEKLAVSPDGTIVDFGFELYGKSPLRFNVRDLTLKQNSPADGVTRKPLQTGLSITNWQDESNPKLNGKPVKLQEDEKSQSLAIHPDKDRLVLGTDYSLRALASKGDVMWEEKGNTGPAWAVNITSDGRMVVAAYHDGTIRWHRMDDGRELMALMVLSDRSNWVAWTPEGFYAASPGAQGILRWHVNNGIGMTATTVSVHQIPGLKRPDALPLVLQELETARALGLADLANARRAVQVATGAAKAPGARLHVLAIGVSDYGEKAKHLRLEFAHKDAYDVASALLNTQSGLYAEVYPQVLLAPKTGENKLPDKPEIMEAFAAVARNMAKGDRRDLAVVLFSGHGAVIDGSFYLLPYGVDGSTPARLKASALSATEFQAEVRQLAQHGRVLVLLDACRSGGVLGDGTNLATNADVLRSLVAQSNVTVLTSSSADKVSREDKAWGHGAFTKVLLDAFGRAGDTNHDGVVSMSELTDFMARQLPSLTAGAQQPGIEQRFQSDIFVAGF